LARTYMDRYGRGPLFSTENGVGIGMMNDRPDVILVQYFLKAILQSQKTFLAGNTVFTPPDGVTLQINGNWDEASKKYLARWETLISEARGYWAHGLNPATLYPGTVVPLRKGGKKIIAMNEMAIVMFGNVSHTRLKLMSEDLPLEAWDQLFYKPF
jgi:hypothetical protein